MRNLIFVFMAGILMSGTALADTVATYQDETGEKLTLSFLDPTHIRMDTSEESYLLLSGDKVYAVNKGEDGQWMVMDMAQMKGMAGGFMGGGPQKTYSAAFQKTGRTEKIAGYTGAVYQVTLTENGKPVQTDDVVLSPHPDLEKVNQAWAAIGSGLGQTLGSGMTEGLDQLTRTGYGGLLRYGTQMQLTRIEKPSLGKAFYQIPQGAQTMGGMPGHGQDLTTEGREAGDQKSEEPGALEQDARDVGQAARDQAKDATIDEVQDGVKNVFKSIFN